MKCPNCQHEFKDQSIKCSACGHTSTESALEGLQNLEHLVAWLDEHQGELAAPGYRRLRQATEQQLVELRRQLVPGAGPAPKLVAAPAPTPARPVEQVVRELALATDIRDAIESWVVAGAIRPATAETLRRLLTRQRQQLKAEQAGQAAEAPQISQLDVIDYARLSLAEWIQAGAIAEGDRLSLATYLKNRRKVLQVSQAEVPAVAAPVEQAQLELNLLAAALDSLEVWGQQRALSQASVTSLRQMLASQIEPMRVAQPAGSAKAQSVSELELIDYVLSSVPIWSQGNNFVRSDKSRLTAYLKQRRIQLNASRVGPAVPVAPPITPPAVVAKPTPAAPMASMPAPIATASRPLPIVPRRPAPPPKPARPPRLPINWAKVRERGWQLVVSGALLRGLLYLGALMIVASAVVLVVRFWNTFPPLLQIGFVAAVPISFYAGGFVLRSLKIPVAGGVFTGIGALLVAVDLAAVYQLGGLSRVGVDLRIYWLGSSLFCAALYLFTRYRARGEFFGYLTLVGGGNVAVALAVALRLGPEWWVAAGATAGLGMVALAGALKERKGAWQELARPARYFSQLVLPAAAFLAVALALFFTPHQPWALVATLTLVALGYGGLAWRFAYVLAEYAAVAASMFAASSALGALGVPGAWWAGSGAALAAAYSAAGRWLDLRRRTPGPAQRSRRWAWYAAAGLLAVIGLASGLVTLFTDVWPAVIGLVMLVALLAGWAQLFREPLFSFAAAGLFIVPFTAAVARGLGLLAWTPVAGWIAVAWTALALGYLALAAALRQAERHVRWLYFWAHVVTGLACIMVASVSVFPSLLVLNGQAVANNLTAMVGLDSALAVLPYLLNLPSSSQTTLVGLTGALAVYAVSAVLHDGRRHPALSRWVAWLKPADEAAFLWPIGALLPAWLAVAWWRWALPLGWFWFGAVLAGLALGYVGLGQLLARRRATYRAPWHALAYALAAGGVMLALGVQLPLTVTLYLAVATLAALAWAWRRPQETFLAAALFVAPFQLTLNLVLLPAHASALAYALLAALAYYPLGLRLRRAGGNFAWPVLGVGYAVAAAAVLIGLLGPLGLLAQNVPWIGVAAPLVVLALLVASSYHLRSAPFAWAAAVVLSIAYWQALALLGLPDVYAATAWVLLAFAGLLAERALATRTGAGHWLRAHVRPLQVMAVVVCGLGLGLTAAATLFAFIGQPGADLFPTLLAQSLAVVFAILAARLHRSRWPLYVVPALSFFPATLFFIAYSARLFGHSLSTAQFGLVWMGLALAHLLAAALLDRGVERYSHGLYAGGYFLALLAVGWTVLDSGVLLWTLGLGIMVAAASASLVRANRHQTWEELITLLLGKGTNAARDVVRGAFLWLTAWPLPIWCALLLRQLHVGGGFEWLGFGLAALPMMGLALWLRRAQRSDGWPLHSAAQFYTSLGLLISAPTTLAALYGSAAAKSASLAGVGVTAAMLVQAVAVMFYAASARVFRQRGFAHLAAWLCIVPYTLGWFAYSQLSSVQFALPWIGLAIVLLAIGLALDRAKVRYAHGPYLTGYALAVFALAWSISNPAIELYALGALVVVALVSQALAHFGWHRSFDDALAWLWSRRGGPAERAARIVFLFFAAYAFPVWLAQLLGYQGVALTWRGLALALVAPIYIALGLAARRARPEYTWPLYSAGYALTAIGAMLTFENEALAIYVLALDLVVYAASAVIFRQAFWLYLSNLLLPVIVLVTLHYNHALSAPWVAGVFMGLAFAYLSIGRWLSSRRAAPGIDPFSLPFLAPAYLLSAVSLAVASGDRGLALATYSAGVLLYTFSAWTFREPVFLYPAAWLATVPYYLGLTLTPLPPQWLGLGWLPLVVAYIVLGPFVFQRRPIGLSGLRGFVAALAQPSMPFYLAAYVLSVSMIVISRQAAWPLTLACLAGAAVYFGSAALFRRAVWLYPALLVTHLALLAFLGTSPSNLPAYYASLPFMALTWVVALAGYTLSRWRPAQPAVGAAPARFGRFPSLNILLTASCSQPFFLFVAIDVLLWQGTALSGVATAVPVSAGFTLLLALLAVLLRDTPLTYGALGWFLLATGCRLVAAGVPVSAAMAWYAGLAFGLYWLAQGAAAIAERGGTIGRASPAIAQWVRPLTWVAWIITPLAVAGALAFSFVDTNAAALALAFGGALYLGQAYRSRLYVLGYVALAMLELAWVLLLVAHGVPEPEWYAIPGGLYFLTLAFFERQRGRRVFANAVDGFGLAVLLITAFIQSLNGGATGLPYFILLLVEGMLVIWLGAARRLKVLFFVGLAAEVLNVIGQVVVLFLGGQTALRWIIIGSAGLIIVFASVFVERQRERLIVRAQVWRESLAAWD